MKLYCTAKLQRKLGCKLEKAPPSDNTLEDWYASIVTLGGTEAVVAVLPAFRFCAILTGLQEDQWSSLGQSLAPAIRDALGQEWISQDLIDRYLPESTVFTLCAASERAPLARLNWVMQRVLQETKECQDPKQLEHRINFTVYRFSDGSEWFPVFSLRDELERQFKTPAQAMELEIFLNWETYAARRTLVVSADTTFSDLHYHLQTLYRWRDIYSHAFVLPITRHRRRPVWAQPYAAGHSIPGAKGETVPEEEAHLSDYLREGDTFQYLYNDEECWVLNLRFTRYCSVPPIDLPSCTCCEGTSPRDSDIEDEYWQPDFTAEDATFFLRQPFLPFL